MNEHKRQHYVPRSYLRQFAIPGTEERAISALRLDGWQHIQQVSIETTCQRPYFYGRDLAVEKVLQRIEGAAATVMKGVVAGRGVPEPSSLEMTHLLRFVGLQFGRTPAAIKMHFQQATQLVRQVVATHPKMRPDLLPYVEQFVVRPPDDSIVVTLSIGNNAVPLLTDLRAKVLNAPIGTEFVTSDAPVMLHNAWARPRTFGTTALSSCGLLVFLPLSPRQLLVLFDTDVYSVGPASSDYVDLEDPAEVSSLNSLQVEAADEMLFYSSASMRTEIDRLKAVVRGQPRWTSDRQQTDRGTWRVVTRLVASAIRIRTPTIRLRDEATLVPPRARVGHRPKTIELLELMRFHDAKGLTGEARAVQAAVQAFVAERAKRSGRQ